MRRVKLILPGIVCLFFAIALGKGQAAAASYTYTVTFHAGNQGTFSDKRGVTVDNKATSSEYSVKKTDKRIIISGLKAGDIVSCPAQSCIKLSDDSKYYTKGIRLSGRDNNTVAKSAFLVDSDQDYVAAYGIPGDLTEYTVNYQDEAGNPVADSETFFGNVGDEPVIAYLYIEGYRPTNYNLSKELVADKSQNVFTFIYVKTDGSEADGDGNADGDPNGTDGVNPNDPNADNNDPNGTGDANDPNGDGNDDNANGDGTDANGENANGQEENNLGVNENADELTTIEDGAVPLAQRAANVVADAIERGLLPPVIVGFLSLVGLIVILVSAIRRKKKAEVR